MESNYGIYDTTSESWVKNEEVLTDGIYMTVAKSEALTGDELSMYEKLTQLEIAFSDKPLVVEGLLVKEMV